MTQPVEIPLFGNLDKDEYSKEELLEIWQSICEQEKIEIFANEEVGTLSRDGDLFLVTTQSGTRFSAFHVVLALGRRGSPRKLGVTGEQLSKVLYQLTDARSYQNQHVLVVGGGDSAVEAAIGLARQSHNTVTVSYRKDRFYRIKKKNEERIDEFIRKGAVKPIFQSQVQSIAERHVILATPDGDVKLPNDIVIVQIGGVPPFEMLKSFGIEFGGESMSLAERDRAMSLT